MDPERWKRIKEVLDISLRLDRAERVAYLTRVGETDSDLREEVESLIEAYEIDEELLERAPAREPLDPLLGARLGSYELVERVGAGGMGWVYRAVRIDETFEKEVAIKVVRRGLDLDRVVRQFRRERQISASLDHPNIAGLLDGGTTDDGLPYFVMEFIRGEPVDLYCEGLGLDVAARLRLFAQVCNAVQYAHEHGVVHRDIKPGNILVTGGGTPKLLDFGIAKILHPDALLEGHYSIGTVGAAMTPEYASPEQFRGEPVTEASDIYSLGVLLYQLVAHERPLPVRTAGDPDPQPPSRTERGRGIGADLDAIVLRAIRYNPKERYPSAAAFEADVRAYIDNRPVEARRRGLASRLLGRHKAAIAVAAAALLVAGGVMWKLRLSADSGQVQIVPITSLPGAETQPYFSPDGKKLVYVWSGENGENSDIYVQSLADNATLRITTDPAEDISPVWSPDGKRIAWLRTGKDETAIFATDAGGGVQGKIAEVYPAGLETLGRRLDWSPDGEFLATVDKSRPEDPFHIVLVRAGTGAKRTLIDPPDKVIGDMSPAFSPDGKSVAFLRALSSGIADVYIAPAAGGPARRVTSDNREVTSLAWSQDGRWIVFASMRRRNSALWRVRASGGDPELVPGIGENTTDPVFARDGRMAFTQLFSDANVWRIDVEGKEPPERVISSTQYDSSPQYSPDGSRIAFRSNRSGSNEIWVSDSSGRIPVQLTHYAGPLTGTPRWSPDGMTIAYDTRPDGQADIYAVSSNGGTPRRVTQSAAEDVVPSWSHDGAWIYFASNRTGVWQVWRAASGGGSEQQVTFGGGFAAFDSPDGAYLYYAKGRSEPGLWRKALPSGAEEPVLPKLKPGFWGLWDVTERGIYYGDQPGSGPPGGIFFYDLQSRKTRQVARTEKPLAVTDSAFSVSPDRLHILYTQIDQAGSDLFILERR